MDCSTGFHEPNSLYITVPLISPVQFGSVTSTITWEGLEGVDFEMCVLRVSSRDFTCIWSSPLCNSCQRVFAVSSGPKISQSLSLEMLLKVMASSIRSPGHLSVNVCRILKKRPLASGEMQGHKKANHTPRMERSILLPSSVGASSTKQWESLKHRAKVLWGHRSSGWLVKCPLVFGLLLEVWVTGHQMQVKDSLGSGNSMWRDSSVYKIRASLWPWIMWIGISESGKVKLESIVNFLLCRIKVFEL